LTKKYGGNWGDFCSRRNWTEKLEDIYISSIGGMLRLSRASMFYAESFKTVEEDILMDVTRILKNLYIVDLTDEHMMSTLIREVA